MSEWLFFFGGGGFWLALKQRDKDNLGVFFLQLMDELEEL